MRSDYDGSPLSSNEPYAVLKTSLTAAAAGIVKIPVRELPPGADPNRYTLQSDLPPFTGNGFAGSLDGHLTPEWKVARFPGPPDVTIMRFKNADGSPRQVSMAQAGASDRWVLKQNDPNNPLLGYHWEPLP
ncbi:MAG: hypothetical protein IBJ18_12415 [Phycisphaerales bacterium]|nr:hypothetical protein [Phycisphaerales bacterium]